MEFTSVQEMIDSDDERLLEIAKLAMQVFLKEDLSKSLMNQRGQEWVAKQSFDMADVMMEEFNNRKDS
jgi:hypothetical protein